MLIEANVSFWVFLHPFFYCERGWSGKNGLFFIQKMCWSSVIWCWTAALQAVQWVRELLPASWIHPKHLFCYNAEKSDWEQTPICFRERWCVSRFQLPHSHFLWSQGALFKKFLQGPTPTVWMFPSVFGLLASPGGERWPPRCYLTSPV